MTAKVYRFTCIICPLSCDIEVRVENGKIREIKGYSCPRGKEWAVGEITNPKRVIMSVIKVKNGNMPTVSRKTTKPIPKTKIPELMRLLAEIEVEAPIKVGQTILENPLGLDTKIVATREVEKA